MGTFYDPTSNWLFYIEVDDRRKNVRIVDLKGLKRNMNWMDSRKYEIEFDTEHYMSFAPIPEVFTYYLIHFLKDILFFRPLRDIDEKVLKDLPLRL
mgnify:CR=1 FL=1